MTPKTIVEQLLPLDRMMEWHWWIVDGHALFVAIRCGAHGSYYTADFTQLDLRQGSMSTCDELPKQKPATWFTMKQIAHDIGQNVPGVIRLDLYADDKEVYLSELTFTSASCLRDFRPRVADALVYAVANQDISHELATPQFVQSLIHGRSWVLVNPDPSQWTLSRRDEGHEKGQPHFYPSATDLCEAVEVYNSSTATANCLAATEETLSSPLHCVTTKKDFTTVAIGQYKTPSFRSVLARVDWPWAFSLALLLLVLRLFKTGVKEEKHQYGNVLLYLVAVTLYKSLGSKFEGVFAPASLWTTVQHSFEVFTVVHPISSPFIAFTHIVTYWFEVAAWRSKSLRSMLFWYLMYELVASFVNEYSHHLENDDGVRCMRVSFIHSMKQYAVDDVVRAYLLPPFLVYGYLVPKFLMAPFGVHM